MKIVERDWKYGKYLAYEDVEPELLAFTPHCRVLPAPFFYEKRLFFFLMHKYEPGEHKSFPKGGFEVVGDAYEKRSFDLDQVIIHPDVIKHQKTIDKMKRKAEKEATKRAKQIAKNDKRAAKAVRGRRPLSPEEKALRAQTQTDTTQRSGGKRGRPKSTEPKVEKVTKVPGRKGRPALDPAIKAQREQEKLARTQRSGGKRGRPKTGLGAAK